jgi:hypothetical protein
VRRLTEESGFDHARIVYRYSRMLPIMHAQARKLGVPDFVPYMASGEPFCEKHIQTFVRTDTGECVRCVNQVSLTLREEYEKTRRETARRRREAAGPDKRLSSARGWAKKLHKRISFRAAREGYSCNLTIRWIRERIEELVAQGVVRLEAKSPWSPSADQITAGLGYVAGNVQIVPLWYNFAKHTFAPSSLHAAIQKWSGAQT